MAILYFGIIRNIETTVGSLERISKAIDAEGVERVSISSLNRISHIDNARSRESGAFIPGDDWLRVPADHHLLAQQDDRLVDAELAAAKAQPDPYDDGYRSVRNLLHQLASLRRGWLELERLEPEAFDAYLLLRPDLRYLDRFSVRELSARLPDANSILLPAWHSYGGLNDRFAFARPAAARIFAMRFDRVVDHCRSRGLHSEAFLASVLARAGTKVGELPVRAERVRVEGVVRTVHGDRAENFAGARLPLPRTAGRFLDDPVRFAPARGSIVAPGPGRAASVGAPVILEIEPSPAHGAALRVAPLQGLHYLNFLGALHRRLGPVRYLEIGTQAGRSLRRARGPAVAIDPDFRIDRSRLRSWLFWRLRLRCAFYAMESDRYFSTYDPRFQLQGAVDLAFIDGMHLAEYVLRDVVNVEAFCSESAMILLHDAVPINFEMTERNRNPEARQDREHAAAWTGDVWRLAPLLRRLRPDLVIEVLDCPPTGLVVIRNLDPTSPILPRSTESLTREFTAAEPSEADFRDYLAGLSLVDSRTWLDANAAWLEAIRKARATSLAEHLRTKLANSLSNQYRRAKSFMPLGERRPSRHHQTGLGAESPRRRSGDGFGD